MNRDPKSRDPKSRDSESRDAVTHFTKEQPYYTCLSSVLQAVASFVDLPISDLLIIIFSVGRHASVDQLFVPHVNTTMSPRCLYHFKSRLRYKAYI